MIALAATGPATCPEVSRVLNAMSPSGTDPNDIPNVCIARLVGAMNDVVTFFRFNVKVFRRGETNASTGGT